MTDEEKSEKYATEQMKSYLTLDDYSYGVLKLKITEAHLDGLAEGRKEANEKNFKKAYQKYVNNSLATFDMKKALEDARDQIRIAKENEELKAQIEKMKCCGNCINRGLNKDDFSFPCCDCKYWRKIKKNDYWELAE